MGALFLSKHYLNLRILTENRPCDKVNAWRPFQSNIWLGRASFELQYSRLEKEEMTNPDLIVNIVESLGWFVGGLIGIWLVRKIVPKLLTKTSLGEASNSTRAFVASYVVVFGLLVVGLFGNRPQDIDPAEFQRMTYAISAAFVVFLAADVFRRSRRERSASGQKQHHQ